MKKIYILKMGSYFPESIQKHGDFEEWIVQSIGECGFDIESVDIYKNASLPNLEDIAGVIITGAHSMVTDLDSDSLRVEQFIPYLVEKEIPLFGICYGHQLLAKAMGGKVDYHPRGREVGGVDIKLLPEAKDDSIFSQLPKKFYAYATHSQSVIKLPKEAVLLAKNEFEPHHAFRIGSCAWGVQFHPEHSEEVIKEYISAQKDWFDSIGVSSKKMINRIKPAPESASILKKFVELIGE